MRTYPLFLILIACSTKAEVVDGAGADTTAQSVTPPEGDADTDADTDSDTDADADTDTGSTSSSSTGDTGTAALPCDDYVAREVEVCWSPAPDFSYAENGMLMIWDYVNGGWVNSAIATDLFDEVCDVTQSATGSWIKVQAQFDDTANETPASPWWAIANWYGVIESRGTWTIDGIPVEASIYGNDGQIATPPCQ